MKNRHDNIENDFVARILSKHSAFARRIRWYQIFIILIFVFVVFYAVGDALWTQHLTENGTRINAEIVDIWFSGDSGNTNATTCYIAYQFETNGKTVTRERKYDKSQYDKLGYREGDVLTALYHPRLDPRLCRFVIDGEQAFRKRRRILSVIGLAAIAFILNRVICMMKKY